MRSPRSQFKTKKVPPPLSFSLYRHRCGFYARFPSSAKSTPPLARSSLALALSLPPLSLLVSVPFSPQSAQTRLSGCLSSSLMMAWCFASSRFFSASLIFAAAAGFFLSGKNKIKKQFSARAERRRGDERKSTPARALFLFFPPFPLPSSFRLCLRLRTSAHRTFETTFLWGSPSRSLRVLGKPSWGSPSSLATQELSGCGGNAPVEPSL